MLTIASQIRIFLVFVVVSLIGLTTTAQVSITMPTGGQNISVDMAVGAATPGFTELGDIVISDNLASDFTNGAGRTITLTRPTGWQFEAGVGTVTTGGTKFSATSITVNTTTITVTYTATGATAGNSITISGIRVQAISRDAGLNTTGNITKSGGTGIIAGLANGTTVATLSKVPAAFVKLQVLLPNQINAPATTTGQSGTTPTKNAGTAFDVVVNAVDEYWNIVTTAPNDVIQLTSNSNGDIPVATTLTAGTVTYNVNLKQSGTNRNIIATNVTNGSITLDVSSSFTVNAGAFVKMHVTLPGQTYAAGTPTGNTGAPVVTAGTAFSVTVRSVDDFFNTIASTDIVNLSATGATNFTLPANAALATGIRTFTNGVTFRNSGETPTLTATNVTDGTKTAAVSPSITINSGAFTKLQLLLPGETAAPGTATGKTGPPTTPYAAGTIIPVTVNAVDANWNIVTTVTDVVSISSSLTAHGGLPANAALTAGTGNFNVTLTAAGAQTLRANDITDASKTANTSPSFTVNPGAFTKLLVILPGETYAAGSVNGKTGTPTPITANTNYTLIVRGVDANWNTVTTANDIVNLTTTDPTGTFTVNNLVLVNGVRSFANARLRTAGNTNTVTATYTNDLTKTAYTTAPITVVAGAFTKLVLILPGETEQQGIVAGKTGTPSAVTAGTSISVKVNAVDANGNIVTMVTDVVSFSATNDAFATLPANTALINGTLITNVTYRTAGAARSLRATDVTDGTKTASTSPTFTVSPGAFTKLLVVLPGETYLPGSPTGKTGAISNQGINVAFNVAVRAVDDNWNLINTVTDVVRITSSDVAAILPVNAALVAGVKTNFAVRLNTAGTQTVTATNITDGTKIPYTTAGILVVGPSSASNFFRSAVVTGVWNNSSSWESSPNGSTLWQPATLSPTSAANAITIRTGHTISVTANVTVDQVIIDAGGQVSLTGGTLTIANGADAFDFVVNGVLSSRSTITLTGALQFSSTGRYVHAFTTTAGIIPAATWTTGSICEISGYTTFAATVSGSGQAFSDVIWNATNQTATGLPSLSGTFSARSFTVLSTGLGAMNFASTGGTVTITGDFSQSAGIVGINKTSGVASLNVAGNVSLLGGTLRSGNGTANFNFNGSSTQTYAKSSSTIAGAINFSIGATSIVDFGTSVIDGSSGTFTLQTGGSILTANASGIAATGTNAGTIQVTGTRTYNQGNYTYNGSVAQVTGTGLPTTVSNLTINNANGVTLPATANTYTVNGTLTINPAAGSLNMSNNVLSGTFANTGAGTLITAATNAFDAGKTWNVGVTYNSGVAQNIVSGTYQNLLATSGAGVKTGPVAALNVRGNWSSSGGNVDLITNATPISFNGTNQSISADNLLFSNVTFATGGTKTLTSGNFSIAANGTLTMANVATLNANGNLTLLSTATSSARVAAIPSGAAITGNVTVQRFITGGPKNPYRTWRMLSSPVAGFTFNQLIDDILITGTGGAANGFDPSSSAASAYVYGTGFEPVTNINQAVPAGKGIYLTYRGDRTNESGKITPFENAVDPESTVVDFTGTLNQSDVAVSLSGSSVNLLGNPYASTINWIFVNKSGLANSTIRIWNPANRNYAIYDDGSISAATALNGGSEFIPSGQGFFVSTGTSLTFTEGAKDSAQPSTLLLSTPVNDLSLQLLQNSVGNTNRKTMTSGNMTAVVTPVPSINLKLTKDLTPYSDEINISMKAGRSANFVANEDILTFGSSEISLSSLSLDGRRLAANRLPELSGASEVKLSLGGEAASRTGSYHLVVKYTDVPAGYLVQLTDKYTNTTTTVSNGDSYAFDIDKNIGATFGADRLSLSISPSNVLPVQVTAFNGSKATEGVILKWTTSSEIANDKFEIERASEDGVFKSILSMKAKGPSSYQLVDKNPLMGNNYYKLKQIDKDGTAAYHNKVVAVNFDGVNQVALSVYPNPVTDKFTVKYSGTLTGDKQTIKIVGATGKVLFQQTVTATALTNGVDINIGGYAAGVYLVNVVDAISNVQVELTKLIKL